MYGKKTSNQDEKEFIFTVSLYSLEQPHQFILWVFFLFCVLRLHISSASF